MSESRNTTKLLALSGTSLVAAMLLAAGPGMAQAQPDDDPSQEDAVEVAEIVITGTSIRGVPPTGSNLISMSRDDIQTIGAANTPDLLASVP